MKFNNEDFYGTTIVTGAGIGRKEKDHLLVQLLERLNISFKEFAININYAIKSRLIRS